MEAMTTDGWGLGQGMGENENRGSLGARTMDG